MTEPPLEKLLTEIVYETVEDLMPANQNDIIKILKEDLFTVEYLFLLADPSQASKLNEYLTPKFEEINKKCPSFFADESVFDRLTIIERSILYKFIKALGSLKENKLLLLTEIEQKITDLTFLNPIIVPQNKAKEILSYIQYERRLMSKSDSYNPNEYYYWNYPVEKLHQLYNLLLQQQMVAETTTFLQSFSKYDVDPKLKIIWKKDQRSLFALLYLIYKKEQFYYSETIDEIAFKLFVVEGSKLLVKYVKENYRKFFENVKDPAYMTKKHSKILDIISELDL
ncbi:hypothetical protein [Ferruginibacter sp. SUN106]|uniref:hypothetical protein n=1 Tax=Ferruginibacter sp. SUN106 TaxID=2978348 RepID=UPI003D3644C5